MKTHAFLVVLLLSCGARSWAGSNEGAHADASRMFDGLRDLVADAAAVTPASSKSPVRPSSIFPSELARRLQKDPKTMAKVVAALRSTGENTSALSWLFGAIPEKKREELFAALSTMNTDFLDHYHAVVTVAELRLGAAKYRPKAVALRDVNPDPNLILSGSPRIPPQYLARLSEGVYRGALPRGEIGSAHGDNKKIAAILNRLAINDPAKPGWTLRWRFGEVGTVDEFVTALKYSGHSFTGRDMRIFVNFGQILVAEKNGLSGVLTPLYVNTGLKLPGHEEFFEYPVVHSQINIRIRGPVVNADVIYYFGADGEGLFYPDETIDQAWVGGRAVETAQGDRAMEWIRRAAVTRREFRIKAQKYNLPQGGYGPLGVCDDVNAMITGNPIYPQVRDMRYFDDGMVVDKWAKELPVDNFGLPDPERIYAALAVSDPDEMQEFPKETRDSIRELKAWVESRRK